MTRALWHRSWEPEGVDPWWETSLWWGSWREVTIGWRYERHPSEWYLELACGPFALRVAHYGLRPRRRPPRLRTVRRDADARP